MNLKFLIKNKFNLGLNLINLFLKGKKYSRIY